MAYIRTTEDEFQIHGNYSQGFEELTSETTWKEAKQCIKDYRENEPGVQFKIVTKRIQIEPKQKTYRIVRMYKTDTPKKQPKLPTGLSLKEAKEYCKQDSTQGKGWFDAFEEE